MLSGMLLFPFPGRVSPEVMTRFFDLFVKKWRFRNSGLAY